MEVLIGIEAVHAIIDEMAEPLQHIVAQALEEQARQFADRGQDAGDGDIAESREGDAVRIKYMENAHNAEVEKLQAPKKTESNSLTTALAALKVPFRAIAAKETEWEVPNGNSVRNNLCIPLSHACPSDLDLLWYGTVVLAKRH